MRIDDTFSASTDVRSLQVERTPETQIQQEVRGRGADRAGDSADLSSLSTDIARALAEDSPQEIARVERAQEAVAAGNFSVPAEEVADSLIDAAIEDGRARAAAAGAQGGAQRAAQSSPVSESPET